MIKGTSGLLHQRAAAVFLADEEMDALQNAIGRRFHDPGLLMQALTHPSLNLRESNQRLEFLGDAVLQLCVSQELYTSSSASEGELTFRRQRLVCEESLAACARRIGLGRWLQAAVSFRTDGGLDLDSVLGDAVEALLAAVYLDGGLEAAVSLTRRLLGDALVNRGAELDPKGALQAYCAAKGMPEPAYTLLAEEGPPHRRSFTCAVTLSGSQLARGSGKTKRSAQQEAAVLALELLKAGEGA